MFLNGIGILGNNGGKVRSWWMPMWCSYVRMVKPQLKGVFILKNTAVKEIYDLPVIVRNDEVVGVYLGKWA